MNFELGASFLFVLFVLYEKKEKRYKVFLVFLYVFFKGGFLYFFGNYWCVCFVLPGFFQTGSTKREKCLYLGFLFSRYSECFTSLAVYCIFCGTLLWALWRVDVPFVFQICRIYNDKTQEKTTTPPQSLCFYFPLLSKCVCYYSLTNCHFADYQQLLKTGRSWTVAKLNPRGK